MQKKIGGTRDSAEQEQREDAERWESYQITGRSVGNEEAMNWVDALARGENQPSHTLFPD